MKQNFRKGIGHWTPAGNTTAPPYDVTGSGSSGTLCDLVCEEC